jgi:hypothetical protein
VGLVDVRGVGELRLLADDIGEDDVLLEQEDLQLFWLLHGARVPLGVVAFDTEDGAVQQQLSLRRDFPFKLL